MSAEAFQPVCEAWSDAETLTSQQAFEADWGYPPRTGTRGVVSLRTRGDRGMQETLWWALAVEKKAIDDLTLEQRKTLARILGEKDRP